MPTTSLNPRVPPSRHPAVLVALLGVLSTATASAQTTTFRPSDARPKHDDKKLAAAGIHRYESKRLRLYTDIDPKLAEALPPAIDAVYDAWVDYFGPLPPNRERTEFQVTGYVMSDRQRFEMAGLIPRDLPAFLNGRHRGAEFWMNDQKTDYYRRHLLIHEATHCFMTIQGGTPPPFWYMEGMAELFGTHRKGKDGKYQFRVMPENVSDYLGQGRILIIREEIAGGRGKTLDDVFKMGAADAMKNEGYAWSWGVCALLDGHPRWKKPFRELGQHLTAREFDGVLHELFDDGLRDLRTDWELFASSLQEGYDIERAALIRKPAKKLAPGGSVQVELAADRGWQSTGVELEAGADYEITATGRFTLANRPKPWISEPQGISIRYFDHQPLGLLLGWVDSPDAASGRLRRHLASFPIGARNQFRADAPGILSLRVNDSWSDLSDNTGNASVTIRRVP